MNAFGHIIHLPLSDTTAVGPPTSEIFNSHCMHWAPQRGAGAGTDLPDGLADVQIVELVLSEDEAAGYL